MDQRTPKHPPFTCSICEQLIVNENGHDASPIKEGRCCDHCSAYVLLARIRQQ